MKKLFERWGDQVQFVDVIVRQAHPGPDAPPYKTGGRKIVDARAYKAQEGIPWPVVADEVDGTVHRAYGGMADPTFLVDADGRVAFYNMWTHAPTLHTAIRRLVAQGGRGVVCGGIDRTPHLLASVADGWRGLERGLPQSFTDLEAAAPGMAASIKLGSQFRPLLAPVALRSEPLPRAARISLAAGAAAAVVLVALLARGPIPRR